MPWCALFTAVKNYYKSLEKLQDFFFKTETKCSRTRPRLHDPRPRLSFFLPEAPRDQDPGLEDYTAGYKLSNKRLFTKMSVTNLMEICERRL